LHIEVTGNTYKAFANGSATPATQYTNANYPTGRFVLRDYSSQSFDNVCIGAGGPTGPLVGDVNGDGSVNVGDIPFMVNALIAPAQCGGCNLQQADVNGDGAANGRDL